MSRGRRLDAQGHNLSGIHRLVCTKVSRVSKLNFLSLSSLLTTLSTIPVARTFRRVFLLGPAALQFLLSSHAAASTVVPVSPKMAIDVGGYAFAGTVTRVFSEKVEKGMIVTRVVFRQLEMIMGKARGDSLVLSLLGGTFGSRKSIVPGQPSFELSKRYILIAKKSLGAPEDFFIPIVGMYGGYFVVEPDTKTGLPSVHDWSHRPLVSAIGDQIIVEVDRDDPTDTRVPTGVVTAVGPSASKGRRVSEREFITLLQGLAKGK